ncbi:MAG: serine hydrolase domain-containing protein [Brevundimonas sp.]|uniref:serine hydrolase domain-containing protein n=1 Tax=Brevundimonas sp. TaxID=1871086 RepID=UPI0027365754|nr:serine hydrolase domain-containing protein [Brevundimonas sp.]MDP3405123.1 serine hydrolase domain-containing protein [Brevundimonas sp.]
MIRTLCLAPLGLALLLGVTPAAAQASPAQTPPVPFAIPADMQVLFWPAERRERDLRRMPELIPHAPIAPSPTPRPLPAGPALDLDLDAFMQAERVAGLLVIHRGQVRLERYGLGLTPADHWGSFSMTKSLTSTLVGAALSDGTIRSTGDLVTDYLPDLAGGAYDGVTVAQVLTMTSGVRWNEDYTDPASDAAQFYLTPPPADADATVAYLKALPRAYPPGQRWNYNTGETNLIGVLVARATGRPLADYLKDKVWDPAGMESPAFWMLDAQGKESGGCCVSATLRDWGRVGLMALERGTVPGGQIATPGWFEGATAQSVDFPDSDRGYGAQWWTRAEGAQFEASGIFGQMIHVDPARDLVVVFLASWPVATGRARSDARLAVIDRIKAEL